MEFFRRLGRLRLASETRFEEEEELGEEGREGEWEGRHGLPRSFSERSGEQQPEPAMRNLDIKALRIKWK